MVKVGDIKKFMGPCKIQYTIKIVKKIIQNTSAGTKNNHHNKNRTGLPNTLTTGMGTELGFKNLPEYQKSRCLMFLWQDALPEGWESN